MNPSPMTTAAILQAVASGKPMFPDPPTGVWVVAYRSWIEGPGEVIPYPDEIAAMRAANEDEYARAWFVPFGKDLREVMNERFTRANNTGGAE